MARLRLLAKFAIITIIASGISSGQARAHDTVTVTIVGGDDVMAYLKGIVVPAHVRAASPYLLTSMQLRVDDRRGTASGWQIGIGVSPGQSRSGHVLTIDAHAPVHVEGQPISETGPFSHPVGGGSLESVRRVLWAETGAGSGVYVQRIDLAALSVPSWLAGGEHRTLTVTIGAAP